MLQSRPITWGRQRHRPPNGSQVSLSAPTSWQPQGNAPLLKKADRDAAEARQKGEEVEGLQEKRGLVKPQRGRSSSSTPSCHRPDGEAVLATGADEIIRSVQRFFAQEAGAVTPLRNHEHVILHIEDTSDDRWQTCDKTGKAAKPDKSCKVLPRFLVLPLRERLRVLFRSLVFTLPHDGSWSFTSCLI